MMLNVLSANAFILCFAMQMRDNFQETFQYFKISYLNMRKENVYDFFKVLELSLHFLLSMDSQVCLTEMGIESGDQHQTKQTFFVRFGKQLISMIYVNALTQQSKQNFHFQYCHCFFYNTSLANRRKLSLSSS
uniref:Uncharacterized protein n=1 Tax=Glossina austeni TaxID=7395 RepID=A0A1A9UR90_GLOAU